MESGKSSKEKKNEGIQELSRSLLS